MGIGSIIELVTYYIRTVHADETQALPRVGRRTHRPRSLIKGTVHYPEVGSKPCYQGSPIAVDEPASNSLSSRCIATPTIPEGYDIRHPHLAGRVPMDQHVLKTAVRPGKV